MRKVLLSITALLFVVYAYSQTSVSLVVSGEGSSKQEATTVALRRAIEQAFGVFVSANTAILNDDVVKDEIATVSSGNINRYEELSAFETNGIWGVTLNAVVSIDKLVDYVQSKGAETEFAGQTFAMQMKMRKLNKENEMQALLNLVDQVELLTCSYSLFDYELVQGEAEYVDGNKYRIPLKVYAIKNLNYKNVQKLILDTFKSLALTAEEQSAYASNKYPTNNCKPLVVDGLDNSFCMRSDADFLKLIEHKIRRHIKLNEHCFQVERVGSGKENRYLYVLYSMENIQADYSLSPEIPENVLYNTSGFKVAPNLSLRQEESITVVDLGLSVKWGQMNIGCSLIDALGDYYAWGETSTKGNYNGSTYKYCNGTTMTKYCTKSSYGYNGFTDNKTVLDLSDDVARVKLGGSWRMPTYAEWEELRNNCTWTRTTQNGVNGYRVTSKTNGNSIFLPAAGYRGGTNLVDVGSDGYYWSSSLHAGLPACAWYAGFNSSYFYSDSRNFGRGLGLSVRPVYDERVVDLGLSVKWADRNLGANSPEEYGDYYAWGETSNKSNYNWSTYKYCNGSETTMIKYCNDSSYGYNGFTDNKTVLDLSDDAARVKLGGSWRMPTDAEWTELRNNCTWTWTTQNGVNGYRVTSKTNGNSIFLPAAGCRYFTDLYDVGSDGHYLSSTLATYNLDGALSVFFDSSDIGRGFDHRRYGQSIRPVYGDCIPVESVSLSKSSLTITEGGTYQLTATVKPANAWNTSVNWTSNNTSVATVTSTGLVTAVSPGAATITATTYDGGYTATCTVTVTEEIVVPDMIDLGLSVKWGSFNFGADSPEGFGCYYAWGETAPKTNYDWSTYKYCNGSETTMIKYCDNSSYGYNGFTDNKTVLDLSDDAARVKLGGSWRMPTYDEWTELREQCTWTWTTQNGVDGYTVTSKTNGNSIFLPAAGYRRRADLDDVGSSGLYWSSTLYTGYPDTACYVCFYPALILSEDNYGRYGGFSIRPVFEN